MGQTRRPTYTSPRRIAPRDRRGGPQHPAADTSRGKCYRYCRADLVRAGETVMAKGQMKSNKEKKKPKADKNIKKGGATPSPFAAGKTPSGQAPNSKK